MLYQFGSDGGLCAEDAGGPPGDRASEGSAATHSDDLATFSSVTYAMKKLVARVSNENITGDEAAAAVKELCALERLVVAARVLLLARVTHSRAWMSEGHRSAAEWLAAQSGHAVGSSLGEIEASAQVTVLPLVSKALGAGELSIDQVREIARVASAHPSTESELVEAASEESLKELRQRCRRLEAAASAEEDMLSRYRSLRDRRYCRSWIDHEGAFCLEARLVPEEGAVVASALGRIRDRLFESAREQGRFEPMAAHEADALVALARGDFGSNHAGADRGQASKRSRSSGSGTSYRGTVELRVDLAALRRGELRDGEVCEIPGIGPVPLATAKSLIGDAWLKLVVSDGVDVQHVTHMGRTIPAHLRSALEARDPVCVVPGCSTAHGLEIDHWQVDFIDGGPTTLENLARLCHFHHFMKTHKGWRLSGGPGRWQFAKPEALEAVDRGP